VIGRLARRGTGPVKKEEQGPLPSPLLFFLTRRRKE